MGIYVVKCVGIEQLRQIRRAAWGCCRGHETNEQHAELGLHVLSYTAKCYSSIIAQRLSSHLIQHQQLLLPYHLPLRPASEHHSSDVYTTGCYVVFIPACPSVCPSSACCLRSLTSCPVSHHANEDTWPAVLFQSLNVISHSSLSFSAWFSVIS